MSMLHVVPMVHVMPLGLALKETHRPSHSPWYYHTCPTAQALPSYTSFATMKAKLSLAVKEGVGFELT